MLALAFALAAAMPSPKLEPVDPRTVQSATIYELNVDDAARACASVLVRGPDGQPALCKSAGRHFDLKPSEVTRALALLNERLSYASAAHPACNLPHQAVVFQTTEGPRAFDISFDCRNVNGRVPTQATARALALFVRSFGFVAHVPLWVE